MLHLHPAVQLSTVKSGGAWKAADLNCSVTEPETMSGTDLACSVKHAGDVSGRFGLRAIIRASLKRRSLPERCCIHPCRFEFIKLESELT